MSDYTPEQLREIAGEMPRRLNKVWARNLCIAHAAALEKNARLRKHAEAMEQAARKLAFTGAAFGVAALDDACDAYRADFPKEPR